MLEHLNGADEFEASVLERQLIRRSGLEREVESASVLPFVLQPDVLGVDSEHPSRLEPSGEAFGDYSLAAADIEDRARSDALSRLVESAQETLEQSADDRIRLLVLRRCISDRAEEVRVCHRSAPSGRAPPRRSAGRPIEAAP